LLLKEVHHRIKNYMNTIYGLLLLQAETLTEQSAIKALNDAGSRVQNMMSLYDKLYHSAAAEGIAVKNYIESVVDEIIGNFSDSTSVKVRKEIDDLILDTKRLQPLGIIINELLTNIMKYAFKERSDGLINVSVVVKGNNVSLIIQDNGAGIPESINFENSTGFGLMLVDMLAKQLGGTIRIERGVGTKFVMEFKV